MLSQKKIYNAYYKREANVSNSEIYFALKQNFRLLKIYRKENKLYLDHKYDFDQEKDLDYCLKILDKVINLSPQPAKVIDRYNRPETNNDCVITRKVLKYRKFFAFKNYFRSNKMIFDDVKKHYKHDLININNAPYDGSIYDIIDKKKRLGINNKQKINIMFKNYVANCINDKNKL